MPRKSNIYTVAELIADKIKLELGSLDGISAVAYRQQELESELEKVAGEALGAVVLVAPGGGDNPNAASGSASGSPKTDTIFSVAIHASPIISDASGFATVDIILEDIVSILHGLEMDPDNANPNHRRPLIYLGWDLVRDDTFLIYAARFRVRIKSINPNT